MGDGSKLLCIASLLLLAITTSAQWVWKCDISNGYCSRLLSDSNAAKETTTYPTLEVCRLICGQHGGLWPRPKEISKISPQLAKFSSSAIKFEKEVPNGAATEFIDENIELFMNIIDHIPIKCGEPYSVSVKISVLSDNLQLNWTTDESYNVKVNTDSENVVVAVEISAATVFGARHGLETLSQLIEFYPKVNGNACLAMTTSVTISDKPAYAHRGLLLDTARNFLSFDNIMRHIDAMSASKMNVLHWHVTDSQSFPLELSRLPNMTKYGAYSEDQIYGVQEVNDLFAYAKLRGVRVIIEIDAPSHAGNGWQWGPEAGLGNLAVCINQAPYKNYCIQPPCGQLNPINQNLYPVLGQLYKDIVDYLPEGEVFHMGGDEVYINCWNTTQEIIDYFGNKPRTLEAFLDLWATYQAKALETFDNVAGNSKTPIILWTSHLTVVDVIEKYLSKERYVIQTWVPASDTLPNDLLNLGYRVIVSTKDTWYLDHGFWGSTLYHNWRTVYNNKIPSSNGTLGGEVCMWGELVDSGSVTPRTWPRAAAAAERLWSNPSEQAGSAEQRFYRHRERLVSRGIDAEAVAPKWCYQNEGQCT